MFATPDAHVTGGTAKAPGRLRLVHLERVVDPGLPPGIWAFPGLRRQDRGDRRFHLRGLGRGQLDVHESQIIEIANLSPVRGISLSKAAFTRSGDACTGTGDGH